MVVIALASIGSGAMTAYGASLALQTIGVRVRRPKSAGRGALRRLPAAAQPSEPLTPARDYGLRTTDYELPRVRLGPATASLISTVHYGLSPPHRQPHNGGSA